MGHSSGSPRGLGKFRFAESQTPKNGARASRRPDALHREAGWVRGSPPRWGIPGRTHPAKKRRDPRVTRAGAGRSPALRPISNL